MFDSFRPSAVPAAMSPRRPRVSRVLGLGLLALSLGACAQQGEGERCDPLSYSEDCESGMICTPLEQLNQGSEGAVCCPATPTQQICRTAIFDFTEDAGTNESSEANDGGANPTSSSDAAMSLPTSEPNQSTVSDAGADTSSSGEVPTSGETDGSVTTATTATSDSATVNTATADTAQSGSSGVSSEPATAADGGADAGG